MKSIFIIQISWNDGSGIDFEVVDKAFATIEDAQKAMRKMIEDEMKNTWISKYKDEINIESNDYNSWVCDVNEFERFTEITIKELKL